METKHNSMLLHKVNWFTRKLQDEKLGSFCIFIYTVLLVIFESTFANCVVVSMRQSVDSWHGRFFTRHFSAVGRLVKKNGFILFSTPVLMHGGLICITLLLSLCLSVGRLRHFQC